MVFVAEKKGGAKEVDEATGQATRSACKSEALMRQGN
jgi:hypothetical protein